MRIRNLLCAALLFGAAAAPALAQDKPAESAAGWSSVRRWLEALKKGLATSAVEANYQKRRGAIAVAAVRGSEQGLDDPSKPYWKGTASSKEERRARRERAELAAAVDLALGGKRDEALKALSDFETAHPESPLLADARQARERLSSTEAASDTAAPQGEAAPKADSAGADAAVPAKPEAPAPKPDAAADSGSK